MSLEPIELLALTPRARLWPWEAEPYRLWSLLDMQRVLGATLIAIVRSLERIQLALTSISPDQGSLARKRLSESLGSLLDETKTIPLRRPFVEQIERLKARVGADGISGHDLALLTSELLENLTMELTEYLFFAVPPSRKWMYLEAHKWFGDEAVLCFDIYRDVRDACHCFALAQWTAAVFHSMRILERGLHAMATDLEVSFPGPMELENWKNLIDQIEKRIRALEAQPKSAQKSEDLKFYSEAAVQFRYFKDAWRNHVSHSRESYDEDEAQRIVTHVRDFMRHLASRRTGERG